MKVPLDEGNPLIANLEYTSGTRRCSARHHVQSTLLLWVPKFAHSCAQPRGTRVRPTGHSSVFNPDMAWRRKREFFTGGNGRDKEYAQVARECNTYRIMYCVRAPLSLGETKRACHDPSWRCSAPWAGTVPRSCTRSQTETYTSFTQYNRFIHQTTCS